MSSYRYLSNAFHRMLVNIEQQNPQLFSFVEELQQIKKLRQGMVERKFRFEFLSGVLMIIPEVP